MAFPLLLSFAFAMTLFGAAIAFGTRKRPLPLQALTTALERLGAMRFPAPKSFQARDGSTLSYREYPVAAAGQVAVVLHGSIHDSRTMHSVGVLLSMQGVAVYALDVRGHGGSGRRGDIDYIGQLEDDLVDLVRLIRKQYADARLALVGHSAGGGLALRFAGGPDGALFDRYVAVAPFLHHARRMVREGAPKWAAAAVPRSTALQCLHLVRLRWFQRLPVLLWAVPPGSDCTSDYSFRLALNFRPHLDWQADIRNIRSKTSILIGEADEFFNAQAYAGLVNGLNERVSVQLLKAADHTTVCFKASAVMTIRKALV